MSNLEAGAPSRAPEASRKRLVPPLVWKRLPWWAELLIIVTGYVAYTRSRVAAPTKERTAYFHASQVWDLERFFHIDIELAVNRVVAAWGMLGDAVGYYYGTLHFIVTPAVLIWLFVKRPKQYPRLRSTIIITTFAALITFWTWPLAPPRFALAGATDILVQRDILHAANPQGLSSMVNLYAAMPSLHCAWAIWCALAIYTTTSGRWRKFVWLYPAATVFVVIGTANHYLLDAVGGVAVVALGLFLTRPLAGDKPRPTAPTESIATGAPGRLRKPTVTLPVDDTAPENVVVLDQHADDGTIDVRRSAARNPSPNDL